MVIIGEVVLELLRTGHTAKLVLTAKPFSHEVSISFEELERLTLYLAEQTGRWRDDRIETENNTLT